MLLKDKVLLVTGGTQGMGLETAIAACVEGARVVICGRSEVAGREALAKALEQQAELDFIACDVTDEASVQRLVDTIVQRYGRLDCAFNNAGLTSAHAKLGDSDSANWRAVIDVNLTGTYLCLRAEINAMRLTGGGSIVNNSSCAGMMAIPQQGAYVASKAAVIALTQSAAIDHATADGGAIRVNAVAPGPILGGMNSAARLQEHPARTERKIAATAMRRMGTGSEVAAAVLWLLSNQSAYITGAVLPIDGGVTAGKF